MKILISLCFSFYIVLMLFSCKNQEIEDLKREQNIKQNEIDSLKKELDKYSDLMYYNKAVDFISSGDYEKAIVKFEDFKMKFPLSNLINEADKQIEFCNIKINEKNINDEKEFNKLIIEIHNDDVLTGIKKLQDFLDKDLSADLKNKALKELNVLEIKKKENENEINLEKNIGIKILHVKTYWEVVIGNCEPRVLIKVKNVSGKAIEDLSFSVQLVDVKKGEIFGDGHGTMQYSHHIPFNDNSIKECEIDSYAKIDLSEFLRNPPNLIVKVLVSDIRFVGESSRKKNIFYKDIKMSNVMK